MRKIVFLCFIGLFLLTAANASAYQFDLGIGNSGISGYAGPYANVSVDLTNSGYGATVTFNSYLIPDAAYDYLMGDGGTVGLNVNGSFGIASITGYPLPGFTTGLYTVTSGNEDGFGSFNLSINSSDGLKDCVYQIVIGLTNTSGFAWTGAENVLTPNNNGNLAAAHIFVTDGDVNDGALATGYASNGTASVPEPTTMLLLGTGLLGLAGFRKKFKKS